MIQETFYDVVSSLPKDEYSFSSMLSINKGHDIFKGHFPDLPILPGVCMMQIVKEQLEKNLKVKLKLQSAANIKFLSLINPAENTEVAIDVKYSRTEEGMYNADAIISVDSRPYFKLVKAIYK